MSGALTVLLVAAAAMVGCGGDDETSTTTPPIAEMTTEPTTPTTVKGQKGEEDEFAVENKGAGQSTAALGNDVEKALEIFFTSGDPDLVCGELATENLLSAAYGDEKGCRQAQVPGATPKAIEIDSLEVTGQEAEATVIPEGGPNDGIETAVVLVDDGGWRVDSLDADIPAGP